MTVDILNYQNPALPKMTNFETSCLLVCLLTCKTTLPNDGCAVSLPCLLGTVLRCPSWGTQPAATYSYSFPLNFPIDAQGRYVGYAHAF